MDYILNGKAFGSVAAQMLRSGWDLQSLRPYVGEDNRGYVTRNHRKNDGSIVGVPTLIQNDTALLWQREWVQIDQAVIRSARVPMRMVADLRQAGLVYNLPNGMGKTVLESAVMGDITGATVSMDPARKSEGDRPEYDVRHLPLPIIHKDFYFTAREIEVARQSGQPLDTTMIEMAGRKVGEEAEKLLAGTSQYNGFSFGGGVIYGYTTFPNRETVVLTNPNDTGWTPELFIKEMLGMRQVQTDNLRTGPWVLYLSPAWGEFLDDDFKVASDRTLRERLMAIDGLRDVRTAYFLTGFQAILVQLTSDVVREVIGMDVTTLQWPTNGGLTQNFKVMAMLIPQLRADIDLVAGIVHGTAP